MVSKSVAIMPPTTTMAKGRCDCEPMRVERAAGNSPKIRVDRLQTTAQNSRTRVSVASANRTGGKHRSVAVGQRLADDLGASGWAVEIVHRDCRR